MPPKKTEQARRSDVSTARFEVMEEDTPGPAGGSEQPQNVTTGAAFAVADGKTTSPPAVAPRIGQEEKKDKEKEAEKKDKAEKDAMTIEVRDTPIRAVPML